MFSQAENQAARDTAADFLTEATAYKAFLKSHELPLSLTMAKLLDTYCGIANMILSLPPTPNASP